MKDLAVLLLLRYVRLLTEAFICSFYLPRLWFLSLHEFVVPSVPGLSKYRQYLGIILLRNYTAAKWWFTSWKFFSILASFMDQFIKSRRVEKVLYNQHLCCSSKACVCLLACRIVGTQVGKVDILHVWSPLRKGIGDSALAISFLYFCVTIHTAFTS